jgi:hypothetical protein
MLHAARGHWRSCAWRRIVVAMMIALCLCADGCESSEKEGRGFVDGSTTADAGTPEHSDASAVDATGVCLEPGRSCDDGLCCEGSACVTGLETSSVCAAYCQSNEDCFSECCAPLEGGGSVCVPPEYCSEPSPPSDCGLILLAEDGTFLGRATANQFDTDSVCNEFSDYGSEFSSTSIFNEFSEYGSDFSSQSAYSEFTSTPPILVDTCDDEAVAYVTKNTALEPRIDPDILCEWLERNGL